MTPELWISIGIFIATAGAGAVAWAQAIVAARRRTDAIKAQAAAEAARDQALKYAQVSAEEAGRQADALEQANELLMAAQQLNERLAPPPWSQAEYLDQGVVSFTNNSGRHMILTSVVIEPEKSYIHAEAAERPHRVENGDAFAVRWQGAFNLPSPQKVIMEWHFEDRPGETHRTERNL